MAAGINPCVFDRNDIRQGSDESRSLRMYEPVRRLPKPRLSVLTEQTTQ
jgi:hypothetical protein